MDAPRIVRSSEKKLVGCRIAMTFADNKTALVWRTFMPRRKEIEYKVSTDLYSVQVFPRNFDFKKIDPQIEFQKWATLEVSTFAPVTEPLETLLLPGGLYAVFLHHGASTDTSTFEYIFNTWLPAADYSIDDRPHFEILGEQYKNNDPDSREEIWIPIQPK